MIGTEVFWKSKREKFLRLFLADSPICDHDDEWVDDWSKPEVEFDDEQQQLYEQELTNLRVLEWLSETTSDPEETIVTIQDDYSFQLLTST